jgi:hypothetical protein
MDKCKEMIGIATPGVRLHRCGFQAYTVLALDFCCTECKRRQADNQEVTGLGLE